MAPFVYSAHKRINYLSLEEILKEDQIINDQSELEFLSFIRDKFSNFKSLGVTKLNPGTELCLICKVGCLVHFFKAQEKKRLGFKIDFVMDF